MEQQWLIKLKLAKAEEAMRAPQIQSTGRLCRFRQNARLSRRRSAGLSRTERCRASGSMSSQGQQLATLIQTPTAAEAAQIQAAATNHIENTRVDAERRRLAQVEIEAKAQARGGDS